jgi:GxxExxY protein
MKALVKQDLIYPELSYEIIGCAYEVFNELGPGHAEKYYQRALAKSFSFKNIEFKEQVYFPLKFKNVIVGKTFLDFEVEEKIIIEIKKDGFFAKPHIEQVLNYIKITNHKLALLINFTPTGIKFKRIVNILEKN